VGGKNRKGVLTKCGQVWKKTGCGGKAIPDHQIANPEKQWSEVERIKGTCRRCLLEERVAYAVLGKLRR